MVIGLGTGSTVFYTIECLSGRIRDGLSVAGVPTSYQTATRAREYGIPLTTLDDNPVLDLAIDGADQIDPQTFDDQGTRRCAYPGKMRGCSSLPVYRGR